MATLIMATSASNLLQLRDVVYHNLSHPLSLDLDFFRQVVGGYLLVANMTQGVERGPERRARDQLQDLKEGGPRHT